MRGKVLFLFLVVGFIVCNISFAQTQTIDRTFDASIALIEKISLEDLEIYRPSLFAVDEEGNIAIYDYAKHALLYLPEQNYRDIHYFAQGLGRGPGEFRNPTDLKFSPDGNIWLTDPEQARISVWTREGELVRTFNHGNIIPEEIGFTHSNYLICAQAYSSRDGLFHLYTKEGTKVRAFGKLPPDIVANSFGYAGIVSGDNNAFYFAGMFSGFIRKYDSEGNQIFAVDTIDPVPTVEVVTREVDIPGFSNARVTKRAEDTITASVDLDVSGSYVYNLFSGTQSGIGGYIDVYEKATGEYVTSIRLKRSAYNLEITQDRLYITVYNQETDAYNIGIYRI